jgi:hypothetical protein
MGSGAILKKEAPLNVIFLKGWRRKSIRGKKKPQTASGVDALRDKYALTIGPARALAAETLILERTLRDLVNQAYALTRT